MKDENDIKREFQEQLRRQREAGKGLDKEKLNQIIRRKHNSYISAVKGAYGSNEAS